MSENLVLKARVDAPVERVRSALTSADEVGVWLADNVDIGPDRYRFWGPSVPEGDKPRQELVSSGPDGVTFTWNVGGEATTVSLVLTSDDEGTAVTLTQSHFPGWAVAASTEGGVLALLGTYWGVVLANLVEHIEGRELTPRQDLTSTDLSVTFDIAAPAERVYDALLDPAQFAQWFGYPNEVEPHVGGRWTMGSFEHNPNPAVFTELVPGRTITLDFRNGYGIASWELAESEGKTRLTFVTSGFDKSAPPLTGWLGWISGFAELRRYLEVPRWRSTWRELDLG
ncbi:SRPBCC family protein [Actinokineospora globicatena]|uniref:SRPBCC family protein n=1 Tax=Actinokineospora globicatena TaxID=103729 RepID=UPI0020A31F61|nr:SRPBCC family protein [Actinokineospora globicatena]MCP2306887.1 Activator of Hsp90 ATPase homolog 1-like protein [Actinokineospora globicatena]GLW82330.1 hypothetical protein Aglo01_68110 [Actinokineospora globicatena]GLW89077.1 hypothetical protein Aglo02_67160 [Actinokineospora globicatena]